MLRKNLDDLELNGEVGDWAFTSDDKYFEFKYFDEVDKEKSLAIIPISLTPITDKIYWMWDGNREEPTFIPSPQSSLVSVRLLGLNGGPDRFHKSMVKGQWV